ncbi:lipoate-protein ligase a [Diplogelasinospora grovesii]|uniref:Putative lipoate-protein ligase A n=1 Tax=Diplogelasinospora grovesii TaxID=303347 RepID=A0AAN6S309_9PEZI|nr:lipoate-protein ligase a [Diplogelasinospora grovesii]
MALHCRSSTLLWMPTLNRPLISLITTSGGRQPVRLFTQSQHRRFTDDARLAKRIQIYQSRSSNPYVNLSVEHYLLQHSHPDSTVLFLYKNRPCVVIGRNQNPWLEVNLALLREGLSGSPIDLVRRRSGGGTVFHDSGNVNWSVICPPAAFDRNKHAEMVVRAVQPLLQPGLRVRVNERHDIVMDVTPEGKTFKVSGSAYKLTRLRSLHHGTCLLSSPNLGHISRLLRSPAEPYIKARGVESVRSPVRNVGIANTSDFTDAVITEFCKMYDHHESEMVEVDDSGVETEKIRNGVNELMSPDWIYGQTPQFTFSTHPTEDDPRERPPLPADLPSNFRTEMVVRHGQIQSASVSGLSFVIDPDDPDFIPGDYPPDDIHNGRFTLDADVLGGLLVGRKIYGGDGVYDWRRALVLAGGEFTSSNGTIEPADNVGTFLNTMLGIQPKDP